MCYFYLGYNLATTKSFHTAFMFTLSSLTCMTLSLKQNLIVKKNPGLPVLVHLSDLVETYTSSYFLLFSKHLVFVLLDMAAPLGLTLAVL